MPDSLDRDILIPIVVYGPRRCFWDSSQALVERSRSSLPPLLCVQLHHLQLVLQAHHTLPTSLTPSPQGIPPGPMQVHPSGRYAQRSCRWAVGQANGTAPLSQDGARVCCSARLMLLRWWAVVGRA